MTKVYENMDELVKEFLDRATNKQCGTYKLPEHTCKTWTHDKGKKYHYHNSGVYPDQSTLHFAYDNYNDVYQDYFNSNRTVTWIQNAYGRSNYPQPVTLKENEGRQNYTFEAEVDHNSTTSKTVSYTNTVSVGVKVMLGNDKMPMHGEVDLGYSYSTTTSETNEESNGQSSKGITTWHWDESPDVYPEGFELWWGVNRYKLQTNPDAQLVTTYTVDATKGFEFAVNCGYKRDGKTHHTTLFVTLKPSDLGYTSNEFKVKVPTKYLVDYYDAFPTINKKALR
jgi:hypothetical protein